MSSTPGKTRTPKVKRALNLQTWLVVIIIAVSSIGLFLSSLAVTTLMRGVLTDRVDADLAATAAGWAQNPDIYSADSYVGPPSEYAVLLIDPNGWPNWINASDTRPDFAEVTIADAPKTVESLPGSADPTVEWRAVGVATPYGVVVIARSLEQEADMIRGLVVVQIIISLLSLVLMAAVGAAFIRKALSPLREVEYTARAIANGDLDWRIPTWPPNTEVGQLSNSLNVMLRQMQSSLKTAQHKEEQMRRFIGDASHELRTPLTSVRGYTELYRSGVTDDADKVLSKIEEESGRMKLLVEDLLALTRAEGSRLEPRQVDMLELVMSARSSAGAAFPGRTIEVENATDTVPLVNGDPDRLHQVLINLISNALRHGGSEAKVTLKLLIDGRDVVLDVIDDGRGIGPDAIDHIFERFYREDASRSRASGGSGLGLSIVKSLVELHGGSISVESELGEGTTFHVRLPRLLNPSTEAR